MSEQNAQETTEVRSTCYMCYNACGIIARKQGNTVVRIEGDPDNPQNYGRLCAKGRAGLQGLYDPDRVLQPLRRGNPEKGIGVDPQWQPIGWDEALQIVTERLAAIRADDPRQLMGCMFDAHVYTQFFTWMAAFGSPNGFAGGAGFYCGNGLHPISALTHGTFFLEPDLDHCNFLIMVGTQNGFVVNHLPMLMAKKMTEARARGMRLVVVDPICTNAASHADQWIPIRPGTDAALALALAHVLVHERGTYDAAFLTRHSNAPYLVGEDGRYARAADGERPLVFDRGQGRALAFDEAGEDLALEGTFEVGGRSYAPAFARLCEHLRRYTPEYAAGITDVPAGTIRSLAAGLGEAARIGATIEIDGHELPLRPACVNWYRGPCAHRHGFLTGFALQLVNMLLGAIDVPGGTLGSNPVGPWWRPGVSREGLLLPTEHPLAHQAFDPYPGRVPKLPASLTGIELFPVAPYASTFVYEALLHPERFGVPYGPQMLLVCRSNPVMSTINPGVVAAALQKIPFIVAFAFKIDETSEFADIVFPDAHYLERLDGFSNAPYEFIAAGQGDWNFMIRQPVVQPPPGVRHWMEVLFELARRIGFSADLYAMLNHWLPLTEPWQLDPAQHYDWDEITDRWLKSHFGAERDLAWFREHGFLLYRKKTIEEAYPRPFLEARIPIYLEHLIDLGARVGQVTADAGIAWDVSDYQPLPDWKPCHAHLEERPDYDLFAVNCKVPFHTFSLTTDNPLLNEIESRHPFGRHVLLNPRTAAAKGLADGAEVWIESTAGYRVRAVAKISNCVRPDVAGFPGLYGKWAGRLRGRTDTGPHFNTLLPYDLARLDTVATTMDMCIKVRVYPVSARQAAPATGLPGALRAVGRVLRGVAGLTQREQTAAHD
jgi:molybdopterin-containing oxidoreductase family molybdopterin binding subunit